MPGPAAPGTVVNIICLAVTGPSRPDSEPASELRTAAVTVTQPLAHHGMAQVRGPAAPLGHSS